MKPVRTKRALLVMALAALAQAPPARAADDYPTKNITVIVPFAAGGVSDLIARIVTDHMSKTLGKTLIIENLGGGGGTIGTARVAAAPPNGYTLLAGSMGSHVSAPVLFPNLNYDPAQGFEPVGMTAHAPAVVVSRKDLPAKDLQEFIAHVRQQGSDVKQAHGGVGAASHMACLLFNTSAKLKPTSVGYRGSGPATNDVLAGHVDYLCEQVVSMFKYINAGAVKPYVVSSKERLPVISGVPTSLEAGLPEFQMSIWSGIFAPKGTPKPIIEKLSMALDKALEDSSIVNRLVGLGATIPPKEDRVPENFAKYVKEEMARWAPILKSAATQ
jgi:tripartite-type tricarboxylate transporter receptor subunit TctC